MKNNTLYIFLILSCIALTILGCSEGESTRSPKQRMYPRVVYPEKSYTTYDTSHCAFTFKYPTYVDIVKDSFRFEGKPSDECWFDLRATSLNASLYCSYYPITTSKSLSQLVNDAFNLAGKHNIKANFRKETLIDNPNSVKGVVFDIEGPVASPVQFYLTDEKNHFFRASLYFNSKVNPDSTAPVLEFMKKDIDTLIASFQWK